MTKFEHNAYDIETVFDETETLDYTFDEGQATRLVKGSVMLNRDNANVHLEQYAFSNALSLSVKLATWEANLERYINSIEHLVKDLKKGKVVRLTEAEVLQKTGQLFSLKHDINLSSDLLGN